MSVRTATPLNEQRPTPVRTPLPAGRCPAPPADALARRAARAQTEATATVALPSEPAPAPATLAKAPVVAASSLRTLTAAFAVTALITLLPVALGWWLSDSGAVTSGVLLAVIVAALSLGVSAAGQALWRKSSRSRDLLFSDLLLWGYLRRLRNERELLSAPAVLGQMSGAQARMAGGLSAGEQAKLLERLARALDARDPRTNGHSRRVARYSWMIARKLRLAPEQVARVRTAAAVHDLGKIETPDSVLNKPGALTDREYATIKLHAAAGARMSEALNDPALTAAVRSHHERIDGSGYPDRLTGAEIPLGARIIAVADTFDAMTANRPYRRAQPHKRALDVLGREAGEKLDADVVQAFRACYSGWRSLTLWVSFAGVPGRMLAQLTGGAANAAASVQPLAAALLAATITAGAAASGAHPNRLAGVPRDHLAAATIASSSSSQAAAQHTAATAPSAGPGRRAAHTLRTAGASVAHVGTNAQQPGTASAAATGGGAAAPASQPASANQTPAAEAPSRTGDGSTHTPTSTSHGTNTPAATSESAKTVTTEGKGSSGETAKGHSEEAATTHPGGGAVGGTVEQVKGKVEEVKGKVEETKAKVVETVGAVTETAKTKVEEVGKVTEKAKAKVEEVAGGILHLK